MTVASGNQLVECQECHNLYHQDCHKPQVTDKEVNDPRLVWYCARCTRQMKRMVRILLYISACISWSLSVYDCKMKIRTFSILKKINFQVFVAYILFVWTYTFVREAQVCSRHMPFTSAHFSLTTLVYVLSLRIQFSSLLRGLLISLQSVLFITVLG